MPRRIVGPRAAFKCNINIKKSRMTQMFASYAVTIRQFTRINDALVRNGIDDVNIRVSVT